MRRERCPHRDRRDLAEDALPGETEVIFSIASPILTIRGNVPYFFPRSCRFRISMELTNKFRDIARNLPSALSSSQAQMLLEKSPPPGAKLRKYTVVSVLNAILYLIKTGCQWRMLPPHFPKWRTVYNHFRSWSDRGWFQKCRTDNKKLRVEDGAREAFTLRLPSSFSSALRPQLSTITVQLP